MLIKMRVINIDWEGEGKIPVAISRQTASPSSVNFREIARGGIQSDTNLKAAYFRTLLSI
jgi:hypothetical protein